MMSVIKLEKPGTPPLTVKPAPGAILISERSSPSAIASFTAVTVLHTGGVADESPGTNCMAGGAIVKSVTRTVSDISIHFKDPYKHYTLCVHLDEHIVTHNDLSSTGNSGE